MKSEIPGSSAFERLAYCLRHPPHNAWLDARAIAADEASREILVRLSAREEFSNSGDRLVFHGGVIASLIDVTGHAAVAVWHGSATPTVSLHIEYLAPAAARELTARGIARRIGRSLARADIEVWAGDTLVALGRGTFSTR